jgi:hypothetical protein
VLLLPLSVLRHELLDFLLLEIFGAGKLIVEHDAPERGWDR